MGFFPLNEGVRGRKIGTHRVEFVQMLSLVMRIEDQFELQTLSAKVDQKTRGEVESNNIILGLCKMDVLQVNKRLKFYNHLIFYDNVRSSFANIYSILINGLLHLPFKR